LAASRKVKQGAPLGSTLIGKKERKKERKISYSLFFTVFFQIKQNIK